jgi:rubrerythrin
MRSLTTLEEFYAHALAIEREAAERYADFAAHFSDRGEETLAGLCNNLARLEREHLQELVRACAGLTLPPIAESQYRWLDCGSPEAPARELFYRIAQPCDLLEIALEGELRAREFFVTVVRTSRSHAVRELAAIMAAEESEHVRWVLQAIEYHSRPPDPVALPEAEGNPEAAPAN